MCALSSMSTASIFLIFFFFTFTATTEIYTLSLHDALPICFWPAGEAVPGAALACPDRLDRKRSGDLYRGRPAVCRSEEHTSELQSPDHLVCRLLLEKKKKTANDQRDTKRCPAATNTRTPRH